jgi:hypothetical protein
MSGKDLKVRFVITDSMQEECFDDQGNVIPPPKPGEYLYGQDAQFQGKNPQVYENNGDGTITDLNTGLMWQKTPDFKRHVFEDAATYCNELGIGGYDDWRLPTVKELYSIADFRGGLVHQMHPEPSGPPPVGPPPNEPDPGPYQDPGSSRPYVDTKYFDFEYPQPLFTGNYWSSTAYVGGPLTNLQERCVFGVNEADGRIKAYSTNYRWNGEPLNYQGFKRGCHIRAVRGEENVYGVNKFVDNGDGTITDEPTGLMWQKADDGVTRTWGESLKYAEDLRLAGYSDWRLPNAKELQSAVAYGKLTTPAIDESFLVVTNPESWFWTNTTLGDNKQTAVYVCFGKAYAQHPVAGTSEYLDWHGAGAQRSDPKTGDPADYVMASINGADEIRIKNYSRCVRNVR